MYIYIYIFVCVAELALSCGMQDLPLCLSLWIVAQEASDCTAPGLGYSWAWDLSSCKLGIKPTSPFKENKFLITKPPGGSPFALLSPALSKNHPPVIIAEIRLLR